MKNSISSRIPPLTEANKTFIYLCLFSKGDTKNKKKARKEERILTILDVVGRFVVSLVREARPFGFQRFGFQLSLVKGEKKRENKISILIEL